MPAFSTLQDNFDDGVIGIQWQGSYGGVSESGGKGRILSDTGYPGFKTPAVYSLIGSAVFAEIFPAAAGTSTGSATSEMLIDSPTGGTRILIVVNTVSNQIQFRNDAGYGDAANVTVAYSATVMRWWRIREAAGQVHMETSPDCVTWAIRRRFTTPAWVTTGNNPLVFSTHRDNGALTNYFEFDNVNLAPVVEEPAQASATDSMAWAGNVTVETRQAGSASSLTSFTNMAVGAASPEGAASSFVAWADAVVAGNGLTSAAIDHTVSSDTVTGSTDHGAAVADTALWVSSAAGETSSTATVTASTAWNSLVETITVAGVATTDSTAWTVNPIGGTNHSGIASDAHTRSATVEGETAHQATTDDGSTWTTTAQGQAPSVDEATAAVTEMTAWSSTVIARVTPSNTASMRVTRTATIATTAQPKATATGQTVWLTTVAGSAPSGSAGTHHTVWDDHATGVVQPLSTLALTLTWAGATTGSTHHRTDTATSIQWTGSAITPGVTNPLRDITVTATLDSRRWDANLAQRRWAGALGPRRWEARL